MHVEHLNKYIFGLDNLKLYRGMKEFGGLRCSTD